MITNEFINIDFNKTFLRISYIQAIKIIDDRIHEGKKFLKINATSKEHLKVLEHFYSDWKEDTREILEHVFTNQSISKQFPEEKSFVVCVNIESEIGWCKRKIREKIDKLNYIKSNIEKFIYINLETIQQKRSNAVPKTYEEMGDCLIEIYSDIKKRFYCSKDDFKKLAGKSLLKDAAGVIQ